MATGIRTQAAARDIYPIFEVDPNPDGKGPVAIGFRGTGFIVAPNLFMSCWHCFDPPPKDGNQLVLVGGTAEGRYRASPLHEVSRDLGGADLATARVAAYPRDPLQINDSLPQFGTDVATFGYPLTEHPNERRSAFKLHGRFLRGYIMRDFLHEGPEGEVLSYEVDMRAPAGLSGAPLVILGTRKLVGVVYGRNEVEKIERFASVDEHGRRIPEVQQLESFALAHHVSTLLGHRSAATGGMELAKLLTRP